MFIKLARDFQGFCEEIRSDMSFCEVEFIFKIGSLSCAEELGEVVEIRFDIWKDFIPVDRIFGLHIGIERRFLVQEPGQDTKLHPGIRGGNLHEFFDIDPPFGEQVPEHEVHDMYGRLNDSHKLVVLAGREFYEVCTIRFPEMREEIPFFSRSERIEGDILILKRRDPWSEHRMSCDHFARGVPEKCLSCLGLDTSEIQEELSGRDMRNEVLNGIHSRPDTHGNDDDIRFFHGLFGSDFGRA